MSADFIVVIPARYASTRLPGKPLVDIGGRSMIEWVYESACQAGASEVIIATDDARIKDVCTGIGAHVELTGTHRTGTDRIAEVAQRLGWPDEQIIVNVQGDEPLLPPAVISQTAELLANKPDASISTLFTSITSEEEWLDPNTVKVVADNKNNALYFSRAPIPYPREDGTVETPKRHIGLYAYRVHVLKILAASESCELERVEKLEQLRALWLGFNILIAEAVEEPPSGVDTPEDLETVRKIFFERIKNGKC